MALLNAQSISSCLCCALLLAMTGCTEDKGTDAPAVTEGSTDTGALAIPPGAMPDARAGAVRLGSYNVDVNQTSVSGLSSGAFMASQLYLSHSGIMVGAGIIAGGPYLCSLSWPLVAPMISATTTCMNPPPMLGPNLPRLLGLTQELVEEGRIDGTGNLADDRIYLFSGQEDEVVHRPVVDSVQDYFRRLGVPQDSIRYNSSVNAGHAIITGHTDDIDCSETESPYINNCDFMQSTRIIKHIYPGANPPAAKADGEMIAFDQSEFLPSNITSMSDTGYVYVPASCQSGTQCRIHVAIHGCGQGHESIGDQYHGTTGYNEMADTNDLIVLYPQVAKSAGMPLNPNGCWDFWGYSSFNQIAPDFYSKDAPQILAIFGMIQRLAGGTAD